MPNPVTGVMAAASVGSAAIGANAAKRAGRQQVQAAETGTAEQRLAREEMRRLLEPYVSAGTPALQSMMGAVGLRGPEEQAAFIAQQEQSPIFQALARQGEEAMAQNASATGGLRGGNLQGALAQFRPQLLNQFLEQQYGRLGGLAQMGQASAAGVGSAGMTSASNIGNLLGQAGAARAGATLGSAQAFGQGLSDIATIGGMYLGRQPQNNLGRLVPASDALIAANPSIF
jgi:hypothetical protein